jgi:hypothetical protein
MRASALALSILFLLGATAFAQIETMRPTAVTAEQVGKEIAVEGRIYTNGKSESGIHLYFGADTTKAFQAIVLGSELHKFKVDVEKKYTRRNVRVTGEVLEQEGKYYILIREPKQIKVVPRKRRKTSN